MTPERAEQVIPAIIVVVAYAHAGLPSAASESRLLGHVGECAVAIVLEKMRGGCFAGGPVRVEPVSIGQIDVEPSVIVIVKEGDAAALRLDDDSFLCRRLPRHWECVRPAFSATSMNWTGEAGAVITAAFSLRPFHSMSRAESSSLSSRELPSTKKDDPRKRRRGMIIECVDYSAVAQDCRNNVRGASHRPRTLGNGCGTIPAPSFTAMI